MRNLTGEPIGRLTVLSIAGGQTFQDLTWLCRCSCGNVLIVLHKYLATREPQRSCGCLRKDQLRTRRTTHGLSHTRTWGIWCGMRRRCLDPHHQDYRYYGGRGIGICTRWKTYLNFLSDMGEAPDGLTLERIDNNLGYSPENCKWATRREQSRNTRKVKLLTLNGKTMILKDWADETGIHRRTITGRLRSGWSITDALTLPVEGGAKLRNSRKGEAGGTWR